MKTGLDKEFNDWVLKKYSITEKQLKKISPTLWEEKLKEFGWERTAQMEDYAQ